MAKPTLREMLAAQRVLRPRGMPHMISTVVADALGPEVVHGGG